MLSDEAGINGNVNSPGVQTLAVLHIGSWIKNAEIVFKVCVYWELFIICPAVFGSGL